MYISKFEKPSTSGNRLVVITTAQRHSTKHELRFREGLDPASGVSEIRDGGVLWQWSQLEIMLNVFRRSTILQNNSSLSYHHHRHHHHHYHHHQLEHTEILKQPIMGVTRYFCLHKLFSHIIT